MKNRIRELRQEKGLTLAKFSDLLKQHGLNATPDSLAKYERGEREPKIETWEKLATFFDVDVGYLQGSAKEKHGNETINILRSFMEGTTSIAKFEDYLKKILGSDYDNGLLNQYVDIRRAESELHSGVEAYNIVNTLSDPGLSTSDKTNLENWIYFALFILKSDEPALKDTFQNLVSLLLSSIDSSREQSANDKNKLFDSWTIFYTELANFVNHTTL